MIRIDKNFPGACLGQYQVEGDTVYAELGRNREEGHLLIEGRRMDYNCSFVFGIRNESEEMVTAKIYINCRTMPRSKKRPQLYKREVPEIRFKPFKTAGVYDELAKQYFFSIGLKPNESVQLANVMYRDLSDIQQSFQELGKKGGATISEYGHSVLGNPLPLYTYQSAHQFTPNVLIVTGYHPMEPEWLATEGIMEALSTEAFRRWRDMFSFYIAPIANPDGYFLGYNACNAELVNFYWDFRYRDKQAPEAEALYRLAERIKPSIYFDFHAYTYQQKKYASPYIKPAVLYAGKKVRQAVRQINKKLIELCGGHYLYNYSTFTPATLATILTNQFNTITYSKFHLHLLKTEAENKKLASEAVSLTLQALEAYGLSDERKILTIPNGLVRRSYWQNILRHWLVKVEARTYLLELVDRFFKVRI